MSDTSDWSHEVALVTGGAGSIGAAIVGRLLGLGARVASADLMPDASPPRSDKLRQDRVDVGSSREVDAWVETVGTSWGAPSIGVICAGISRPGRLVDTSDTDWREVMAVNLDGAFFAARAIIRAMLDAGAGGRIVFVGSWAASAPHPHIGAYSASKAGLRALCRTLALDHAEDGILVNEVAPGIVDAGVSRELFRRDPELERRTRAAIPSGRLLSPDDVARDVAFLAGPDNLHTTGATLTSDGGIGLASRMNPGRR